MERKGTRVAVLAGNPYQDPDVRHPVLRMREAGAQVPIVGRASAPMGTAWTT
jgi:hypothetical protein